MKTKVTCNCCKKESTWSDLLKIGTQKFDDGGPNLELRNCQCGSTLAQEVQS